MPPVAPVVGAVIFFSIALLFLIILFVCICKAVVGYRRDSARRELHSVQTAAPSATTSSHHFDLTRTQPAVVTGSTVQPVQSMHSEARKPEGGESEALFTAEPPSYASVVRDNGQGFSTPDPLPYSELQEDMR